MRGLMAALLFVSGLLHVVDYAEIRHLRKVNTHCLKEQLKTPGNFDKKFLPEPRGGRSHAPPQWSPSWLSLPSAPR